MMSKAPTAHCAKFSDALLARARHTLGCVAGLPAGSRILDPFAGTGKGVDYLYDVCGYDAWGIELEPEWAAMSDRVSVGNALAPPLPEDVIEWSFGLGDGWDAIFTSPCLEVNERVLTADLVWKRAGDVAEGERLMAFDDSLPGRGRRRKWRIADVLQAGTADKECVRVTLADGSEVVCSFDHPWLCQRYSYSSTHEWVRASDLMGRAGAPGRGHRGQKNSPFYVLKQLETWSTNSSYEAGWLAGMFDGEGCLSFGHHGCPKLMIAQNPGPVLDQAVRWMIDLGFTVNLYPRRDSRTMNLYVTGGFPGVLRALGELRPRRLLQKLDALDVASRCIEAAPVAVVAVEPVGLQEIATITTSTGTYIGEGFLHHNTYGNRMADKDQRETVAGTYAKSLGREASHFSSCHLQWGDGYRSFHRLAWASALDVLEPEGWFLLNIKDHYRNKELQHVPEWHVDTLVDLGFTFVQEEFVETPGLRFGANADYRVNGELLILFRAPRS